MSAAGTDSGVDCGAFSHADVAGAALDSFAADSVAVDAVVAAAAVLVADVVVAAAAAAISPRQRCC